MMRKYVFRFALIVAAVIVMSLSGWFGWQSALRFIDLESRIEALEDQRPTAVEKDDE